LEGVTDSAEVAWLLHRAAQPIVLESDDPEIALSALDRVIAKVDDDALLAAHARYLRAYALHRLGRKREACEEATRAIAELEARGAGAEACAASWMLLARAENVRGDREAASAACARVLAIVQEARDTHGYRDAEEEWLEKASAEARAMIGET
jgi:hypothetical protein